MLRILRWWFPPFKKPPEEEVSQEFWSAYIQETYFIYILVVVGFLGTAIYFGLLQ